MTDLHKLMEYVKDLSLNDKKTLTEKALKLAEETGEVASAVLIYEGAHGTEYRDPCTKEHIMEEASDVILMALSIPVLLGFDLEDVYEMMKKKADKWADKTGFNVQSEEQ